MSKLQGILLSLVLLYQCCSRYNINVFFLQAKQWIKEERAKGGNDAFLDGLVVLSVALDDSKVETTAKHQLLSTSPRSSAITDFDSIRSCVTCDGEDICSNSSSPSTQKHRRPKERAIQAMMQDGVDISSYYAKSLRDISLRDNNKKIQQMSLFNGIRRLIERVREIGLTLTGVNKDDDDDDKHDERVVDNLIVLCSCPDTMKRQLSDMSRETIEWDIDAPSNAAKEEGDAAFLRVSRLIRQKVNNFMDELKSYSEMTYNEQV